MTSAPKPIRIALVDDHPLLRQGIAALLADQADLQLVGQASNGLEAIEQFRLHRPDVMLMDLQMPGMNGIDAMSAIRGEFPDARFVVLTTYTGDVQIVRALNDAVPAKMMPPKLCTKASRPIERGAHRQPFEHCRLEAGVEQQKAGRQAARVGLNAADEDTLYPGVDQILD